MDTKVKRVKQGKVKFSETFKLQTNFEKDPHNPLQILPKVVFNSIVMGLVLFPSYECVDRGAARDSLP